MTAEHEAALGFAGAGWPGFLVNPANNRPLLPAAHPQGDPLRGVCRGECGRPGHGFHDATTDPETIDRWWTQHPNAAIGLATGIAFDVLDVDHRDFAEGVADLPEGETAGGPVARSGGGRYHLYFRPTGIGRRVRFSQHCDWLGTDGYVIAPPSRHKSGGTYSWIVGPDAELQAAPTELVEFVNRTREPQRTRLAAEQRDPARTRLDTGPRSWSPAGLIAKMAVAVEGQRNDVLNWAAARIGADLSQGRCAERDALDALDELAIAAERSGLGTHEVDRTIESGYTAGKSGRVA